MSQGSENSDQLARQRAIFEGALDIDDHESRAAFVAKECEGDPALFTEIEALLAAEARVPPTFLDGTTIAIPGLQFVPAAELPPPEEAGSVIGLYTLIDELGKGAFGTVWRARQSEPVRREVALKIIKPGMDTAEVVTRFEAERQALALMDHPSIAQVYDAGTTGRQRPYFVMELVRGQPITRYCDQKNASIEERLGLFMEVCRAVQHAHQKGIIHRDLKPSNILVVEHEGAALPKVIDFGIAKAIDQELASRSLHTLDGQFIGTPQYMSPEQTGVTGADIDTRADVYALGILLYELLTGVPPLTLEKLQGAGWAEMERLIREEEPVKPSQFVNALDPEATAHLTRTHSEEATKLTRHLKGDLDWITMRALEKERDRRYDSAADFARDLERYLANQPVSAGPPTAAYRTRKFIRRHRTATASAASIAVILVLATVVSTWQAVIAKRAQKHSERSVFMIGDAYESATDLAAELLAGLNQVHHDVEAGAAQDMPRVELTGAIRDRATRIVESYYQESEIGGDDEDSRHMRAVVLNSRGFLARETGRFEEAKGHYEEALEIRRELQQGNPRKALYLHNLVGSHNNLGDLHLKMAKVSNRAEEAATEYAKSLEYYRTSLQHARELEAHPDPVANWRHNVALSHYKIGIALYEQSEVTQGADSAGAIEKLRRGFPVAEKLAASDSDYPKWQELLGLYCFRLAFLLFRQDHIEEAATYARKGTEVYDRLEEAGRLTDESANMKDMCERLLKQIESAY